MIGLVFAIVGAAFGVWGLLMSDDGPTPLAVSFVVVGLVMAGVGAFVRARDAAQQ
jgi:hypothetical protein